VGRADAEWCLTTTRFGRADRRSCGWPAGTQCCLHAVAAAAGLSVVAAAVPANGVWGRGGGAEACAGPRPIVPGRGGMAPTSARARLRGAQTGRLAPRTQTSRRPGRRSRRCATPDRRQRRPVPRSGPGSRTPGRALARDCVRSAVSTPAGNRDPRLSLHLSRIAASFSRTRPRRTHEPRFHAVAGLRGCPSWRPRCRLERRWGRVVCQRV
jgi:hypothetical protein